MKAVDLINKIRAEQGVSIAELSRRVEAGAYTTTVSAVGEHRRAKDLSEGSLVKSAKALGYKVMVLPKWGITDEEVISYED